VCGPARILLTEQDSPVAGSTGRKTRAGEMKTACLFSTRPTLDFVLPRLDANANVAAGALRAASHPGPEIKDHETVRAENFFRVVAHDFLGADYST